MKAKRSEAEMPGKEANSPYDYPYDAKMTEGKIKKIDNMFFEEG